MSKQLPPELIEQIMYIVMAAVGWFAKWLQGKNKQEKMKSENEKLKTIVTEYDSAAREALRYARKPKDPAKPE